MLSSNRVNDDGCEGCTINLADNSAYGHIATIYAAMIC